MSDEKNEFDASDWLSGQFNPTEQVPKQEPAQQQAQPTPEDASAFDWLLRPGGPDAEQSTVAPAPAAPTPTPAAPVPPLVVPPTPSYETPTVAYTPVVDEPTRPLSWDEFAASQQAVPPASAPQAPQAFTDQPTEAYTVQPWQPAASEPVAPVVDPASGAEPTSAIDSLFGDHQFQAYEEVGVLKTVQSIPGMVSSDEPKEPRAPLSSTQKALIGVAAGLVGVLILIGMFFLGQHIGTAQAQAPSTSPTGASTKVPTPAGTGGPAAPGNRSWSALQGGECIQPFSSAWATQFTVVDCANDHDAEMVFKGKLPDSSGVSYPTTTQFQTELTGLCSAPTAINYTAAKAVTDLQVSFSYPPSASKWIGGDRTYYCFVDRQSGGALPGDLAVPASTK